LPIEARRLNFSHALSLDIRSESYICLKLPHVFYTKMKKPDYIEAILTNDRSVLVALYQQFFPMVLKLVQENFGSKADAQDIFQEALIVIFNMARKPGFQLQSQFSTFLYGVAFNCWRSRRKKKSFSEVRIPEDAALIPDEPTEVEAEGKTEQRLLLYRAFAQLGADCRDLLLMFFEQKTMLEIAEKMGYSSENYAARRKHMCKERLVELVKSYPEYRELRIR
jgi:RNA polymerase sigma factor (sigma-70 family)